jgi:hypothetical protein
MAVTALQLALAAAIMLALRSKDWAGNLAGVLLVDLFGFLGALTVRRRART